MTEKTVLDFLPQIEKALAYTGTHTVKDVAQAVANGEAQLWVEGDAMIITQVDEKPLARHLVFWLACGKLEDVQALSEKLFDWGRAMGCTKATSVCRKGWARVMVPYGWYENPELVLLERDL